MNILLILGIVAAALVLLAQVRIGGRAVYAAAGLRVWLRVGAFRVSLYPMKPKREKPERERRRKEKPKRGPAAEPAEPGGQVELLKELLPLVTEAAGRLKRKIRIDRLDIDFTVAAPDPAMAAMAFGGANAALGMIVPLLENHFHVKERRIRTAVDFDRTTPTVALTAAFSLTIGQGTALSLHFGWKALRILMSHRTKRVQKQKEAV